MWRCKEIEDNKFRMAKYVLCYAVHNYIVQNAVTNFRLWYLNFAGRTNKVSSQNNELKKVIAKECILGEMVDKQKKELEDEIASVKSNFMKELYEVYFPLFVAFANILPSLIIYTGRSMKCVWLKALPDSLLLHVNM